MASEMELESHEIREKLEDLREQQEKDEHAQSWIRGVALTTALMAVLAAVAALQASFQADEALLASNDAILAQAKATDTWNEFQADGLKDILRQIQATQATDPQAAADFRAESQRRSNLAGQELNQAQELEKERDARQAQSAKAGSVHDRFAWSVAALQVGIGLASVAALTRRKAVWWLGGAFGGLGAALVGWGFTGG
jgi:hypothetical protein